MLRKLAVCLAVLVGQSALGANPGDVISVFDIRANHQWDNVRQSQVSPIDWTMKFQSDIRLGANEYQITDDVLLQLSLSDIVPEAFRPMTINGSNAALYGLDWAGLTASLNSELVFATNKLGVRYTAVDARVVAGTMSTRWPMDTRYVILDRIELTSVHWSVGTWERGIVKTHFGMNGQIYAALTEIPEPASLWLAALCVLLLPVRFVRS